MLEAQGIKHGCHYFVHILQRGTELWWRFLEACSEGGKGNYPELAPAQCTKAQTHLGA